MTICWQEGIAYRIKLLWLLYYYVSFAGLAEHVVIFPMDTLKTNIQCERCGSNSPFKTLNCAKRIVRHDGIMRLWRGVGAMFAGCIPGLHTINFIIYY